MLLDQWGQEFTHQMIHLEAAIHELAGRIFNVGSPKQLGEILFDEMGLPPSKKTKMMSSLKDDINVPEFVVVISQKNCYHLKLSSRMFSKYAFQYFVWTNLQ